MKNVDYQTTNRASKNLVLGTSSATRGAYLNKMALQRSSDPNATRANIVVALMRTSWFERIWYPCFFIAGILCLIFIRPFNFQLCFAVLSLWLYMVADNLVAHGKHYGIFISIFSASLYVVVSFFAKVYGEVIINILLYIPLDIATLVSFKRNRDKQSDEIDIRTLGVKGWLVAIGSNLLLAGVTFVILYFLPGQVMPLLNALSISIFLMALLIRNMRFKEFWWFNLVANIVSIAMWAAVSASSTEFLYSLPFALSSLAALLNNINGIIMWRKIYRAEKGNGEVFIKRNVKINRVITIRRKYLNALKWDKRAEEKGETK